MTTAIVAWSGGKDAALALQRVRSDADIDIAGLLTTTSADHGRVSIHGVPTDLVRQQADRLGLPLRTVPLPQDCSERQYRQIMGAELDRFADRGVDAVVFADIRLDDVRRDREDLIATAGLDGIWPLWGEDTDDLARTVEEGYEAVVVCVDDAELDASFAGRRYDGEFLSELPAAVDPCGEDGAFHTFVVDGPIFAAEIPVAPDGTVTRETDGGKHHYARLSRRGGEG